MKLPIYENLTTYQGSSSGNTDQYSMSFTGNGKGLYCATIKLWGYGISGNLYCKLFASTGTPGVDSRPTGTALATSSTVLDTSLLPRSPGAYYTFEFGGAYPLTNGVTYQLVIERTINTGGHGYNNNEGHNMSQRTSGTWYFTQGTAFNGGIYYYDNNTGPTPIFRLS